MFEHLGGVGRTSQDGDRTGGAPLGDECRWERAQRRHEALGEHEQAGAAGDVLAVGRQHGGQRSRWDGEADEIVTAQLELAGPRHSNRVGQRDAWQVNDVLPVPGERLSLFTGAAAELDLVTGAGE